ncbi:MAG: hypothetical protein JW787_11610 [Sedimentisphaerales bacterium]|nr:hypothetical protein [Sedimentisphaerales bacterium]
MNRRIDIKSLIIGIFGTICAALAMGAASSSSPMPYGRFQLVIQEVENQTNQYVIDTSTGQVWRCTDDRNIFYAPKTPFEVSEMAVERESDLDSRLAAAIKITDSNMQNKAFAAIATYAAKKGKAEITKDILNKITQQSEKNQTAGNCAYFLGMAGKVQDAIIIADTINMQELRNEILLRIATTSQR